MKKSKFYSIIYEDDSIVAVNKVSGLSVTADRWDQSAERLDKLLNAFFAEEIGKNPEAGETRIPFPHRVFIVHRIDRDTSGLVVFAKNAEAHKILSRAFETRGVKKRYIAVVHGRPSWEESSCDLPLVPDGDKKHRTIIDKYQGKKSFTAFRVLGSAGNYSVVEALPKTGRTHQIRVHLTSMGHPIVCDPLYGKSPKGVFLSSFKRGWRGDALDERPLLSRLGLHAESLTLPSGLELSAPLAKDMGALIKQMEKNGVFPVEHGESAGEI
ncbi:RNA pseudouridine synthase [Treponema sp. OttesenSCG-928-L16]|nr:RNA pseudouridine synthase [Treponema sp. OttesenSCG-928-L16]